MLLIFILGWSRRWVTFNTSDGLLKYYKHPSGRVHGGLCVSSGTLLQIPDRLRFICDSGHSLFHFKTYSISQFKDWIKIFSIQYQELQQKAHLTNEPSTICDNSNGFEDFGKNSISKILKESSKSIELLADKISHIPIDERAKAIGIKIFLLLLENEAKILLAASKKIKIIDQNSDGSLKQSLMSTSTYASSFYATADEEFYEDACENIFLLSAEETEALSEDEVPFGYDHDDSYDNDDNADHDINDNLGYETTESSTSSSIFTEGNSILDQNLVNFRNFEDSDMEDANKSDFNSVTNDDFLNLSNSSISEILVTNLSAPKSFNSFDLIKPFAPVGRKELPHPYTVPIHGISLFSILKASLGKDSSVAMSSMPVCLNEPLGLLQRLCEELSHSHLLDTAALLDCSSDVESSIAKLALVATFAISGYTFTQTRTTRKPFTPLLGETFQFVHSETGSEFKFFIHRNAVYFRKSFSFTAYSCLPRFWW